MPTSRFALFLSLSLALLLGACAADPLAVGEVRDLETTWSQLQAGVRAQDAPMIDAVLAPSAEPEVGQRIVFLTSQTESGRTMREALLASSVADLVPARGEIEADGQVLKFEWSERLPARDGIPPFDQGLTIYVQLNDGRAGILNTLAWTRRVEPPTATLPPPQTAAGLWAYLVFAVETRDREALADLVALESDIAEPEDLAAVPDDILRWAHSERYAAAFRGALAAADVFEIASPEEGSPRFEFVETPGAEWPANLIYIEETDRGAFVTGVSENITPDEDRAALLATWPTILSALRSGDADALDALTSPDADGRVARIALTTYGPQGTGRDRLDDFPSAVDGFTRESMPDGGRIVYGVFPETEEDIGGVWLYLVVEDGRALLFSTLAAG